MQRRNLFRSSQPHDALAIELLSIPDLEARADGGLRIDAPMEAAQARERLVQLYRSRSAAGPYLDLYRPRRERAEPWGAGDVEGLAWLCRLADTGHIAAARIADRAIHAYARMMSSEPLASRQVFEGAAGWRLMSLANRHPRVARGLAMIEAIRADTDIAALADWLELAGAAHAELAGQIRELIDAGAAEIAEEVQFIRKRARSQFGDSDYEVMEVASQPPMVVIGCKRLEEHRVKPLQPAILQATLSMLERAERAGSANAEEALWLHRFRTAPDCWAFVREWLESGAKAPHRCATVSLGVAMALEEGKLGDPPDVVAAMPWYSSAVRKPLSADPIDGATCASIAFVTARVSHLPLAFRWLERGIALGDADCIAQWMEIRTREKTGIGLDVDAVLERARAHFTPGASVPDNYSLEKARTRASIYFDEKMSAKPPDLVAARKWLEICALLGDAEASKRLREFDTTARATTNPAG